MDAVALRIRGSFCPEIDGHHPQGLRWGVRRHELQAFEGGHELLVSQFATLSRCGTMNLSAILTLELNDLGCDMSFLGCRIDLVQGGCSPQSLCRRCASSFVQTGALFGGQVRPSQLAKTSVFILSRFG